MGFATGQCDECDKMTYGLKGDCMYVICFDCYYGEDCDICGDYHDEDSVPLSCATGDGVCGREIEAVLFSKSPQLLKLLTRALCLRPIGECWDEETHNWIADAEALIREISESGNGE